MRSDVTYAPRAYLIMELHAHTRGMMQVKKARERKEREYITLRGGDGGCMRTWWSSSLENKYLE